MRRLCRHAFTLAAGLFLLAPAGGEAQGSRPALVPEPAEVAAVDGAATISSRWSVRVPAHSPADTFAASLLIEDVRTRFGWRWSLAEDSGPAVILRPSRPAHRGTAIWNRQGYELEVWPDSIVIRAPTETGRYYGVQTLRQILRGPQAPYVPGLVVRDGPELAWRGLTEHVSRGQMPTLEEFKRTVATLGYYKANVYQLNVEDAFEYQGAPEIGRGRSRLPAAELHAIVEEGRRHHVTVIPVFECLSDRVQSHATRRDADGQIPPPWSWHTAGIRLGELVHGLLLGPADEASAHATSFAPSSAGTRSFVKMRITELSDAAPGAWFALGGRAAWLTDVARRERGAQVAAYYSDLSAFLGRTHRRVILDADELLLDGAVLDGVPRDVVVTYRDEGGSRADSALFRLRAAGFARVRVAPALSEGSSFFPRPAPSFDRIASLLTSGMEARAEGLVAEIGRGAPESFKVLDWPACVFTADAAWSGAADTTGGFLDRFATAHFGVRSRALAQALGGQELPGDWNAAIYQEAPVAAPRPKEWMTQMRSLELGMARARRTLAAEGRAARWNRDQLECFDHAARRVAFVARRELLMDEIGKQAGAARPRRSRRAESPERRLTALRDESAAIAAQYDKLWRARYRPGGLRPSLMRLESPAHALDSLRAAMFPAAPVVTRAKAPAIAASRGKRSNPARYDSRLSLGY